MFGVGIIRGIFLERSLIRYYLWVKTAGPKFRTVFAVIRLQVGDFTYWLTSRQGLGPLVSKVPSFRIRRYPFLSPRFRFHVSGNSRISIFEEVIFNHLVLILDHATFA